MHSLLPGSSLKGKGVGKLDIKCKESWPLTGWFQAWSVLTEVGFVTSVIPGPQAGRQEFA